MAENNNGTIWDGKDKSHELEDYSKSGSANISTNTREYAIANGLGYFLDKPQKLNEKMLAMLRLSYMMQADEHFPGSRGEDVTGKEKEGNYFTMYPQGKFVFWFASNGKSDRVANSAFERAVNVYAMLDIKKFIQSMIDQGATGEQINEYLKDYYIEDQSFVTRRVADY